MTNDDNIVRIWTDGACPGNPGPGPGGWAYIKRLGARVHQRARPVYGVTTNIAMEMVAVVQALRSLSRPDLAVIVHTDLKLIVQGVTEWIPRWRSNGWLDSKRKPVAHQALWEELARLVEARAPGAEIAFVWVPRASNEAANELAQAAGRKALARVGALCRMETVFDPVSGLVVPAFDCEDAA